MPPNVKIDRIAKDVFLFCTLGGFAEAEEWPRLHAYGWDEAADAALVTAHRQRADCNGRLRAGGLVEIAEKFHRPVKSIAQHIHLLKHRGELPFPRKGYGLRYERKARV